MAGGRCRIKDVVGIVVTGILFFVNATVAQINQEIMFQYCVAHPDTECFSPVPGAIDTVGRDVAELGGGYRFCLNIEKVEAGLAPIRVMLVLDRSYSMCKNSGQCCQDGDGTDNCMMNDPEDKRIQAAIAFVDSLAQKSPNSEVGVVSYDRTADTYTPVILNSPGNIDNVHKWISSASCAAQNYDDVGTRITRDTDTVIDPVLTKTAAIKATYLGLGLEEALDAIDQNFTASKERHIILLTDGAWDDPANTGRLPGQLVATYKAQHPDRDVPTIHGVFISNAELHTQHGFPAEGCSNTDPVVLDSLKAATLLGDTVGLFFGGSTPQTVVANFDSLLKSVTTFEAQRLTDVFITNTTNNKVSTQKNIDTIPLELQVQYQTTIDNLPLEFGLNNLIIKYVVKKPGVELPETTTTNVAIYRTKQWATTINENSEEYQLFCTMDSTTINITVTPEVSFINKPFDVNSHIVLKSYFELDTIQARILTQNSDVQDNNTVALFHFENSLRSTSGIEEGTNIDVSYTSSDALFGEYALESGSFKVPVGMIPEDFSVETWIKPSSTTGQQDIFNCSSFSLSITNTRYLTLNIGSTQIQSKIPVDAHCWSHIAVSRISGKVALFINGIDVSEWASFTEAVSGVLTVSALQSGVLDELRISSVNRLRVEAGTLLRFDIASIANPTWIFSGEASVTQPVAVIAPEKWNAGTLQFQFSVPTTGKVIINFQHRGTLQETQWAKNGNPVTLISDIQGPYVENSIFTRGAFGTLFDTFDVYFTEPVRCDSLMKNEWPGASFEIYDSNRVLKSGIFDGATYVDDCSNDPLQQLITDVRILVKPMKNGITPKRDSVRLIGTVVDTAGNYPDTTKRGPINFGPGSGVILAGMPNPPENPPMTLSTEDMIRLGIPSGKVNSKLILLQTQERLVSWGTSENLPNYAEKSVIYDAVGNIVCIDAPIRKSQDDDLMYYIVWNGLNTNNRRVSSGAYLFQATIMYVNDTSRKVKIQRKFHLDWGSSKKN